MTHQTVLPASSAGVYNFHNDAAAAINPLVDALVRASKQQTIRNQIIRVVGSQHVIGLIGILFGKFITGATVSEPESSASGMEALERIIYLPDVTCDVLVVDREVITRKLKQNLGLDLHVILDVLTAQRGDLRQALRDAALEQRDFSVGSEIEFVEGVVSQWSPSSATIVHRGSTPADGLAGVGQLKRDEPIIAFLAAPDFGCVQNADASPADSAEPASPPAPPHTVAQQEGQCSNEMQRERVFTDLEATLNQARALHSSPPPDNLNEFEQSGNFNFAAEPVQETDNRNWSNQYQSFDPDALAMHRIDYGRFQESNEIFRLELKKKAAVDPKKFVNNSKSRGISNPPAMRPLYAAAAATIGFILICAGVSILQPGDSSLVRAKIDSGDFEGARRLLDNLISRQPTNAGLYAERARTYALAERSLAVQDFKKALELADNPDLRAKYADFLLSSGDINEALKQANRVLAKQERHGQANAVVGMCHCKLGNFAEAIPHLQIALRTGSGDHARVSYGLYTANKKTGRTAEAALYLEEAIKSEPANVQYLLDRARYNLWSKNYDKAVDDLSQVSKLAPLNAECHLLLGICNYEQGRMRTAVSEWTEAIDRGDSQQAYFHRGHAYFELGLYAEALADLDRYLQTNSQDKLTRRRRQLACERVKSRVPKRAQSSEERSTPPKLHQYPGTNLVQAGYAALQAGDCAAAISTLAEAIIKNPDDADARKYLAYSYLRAGKMADAFKQLESWNYLKPAPLNELRLFAKSMTQTRNYGYAAQIYEKILKADPGDAHAKQQVVRSLALDGQTARARALCLEYMSSTTDQHEYELLKALVP